MVEAAPVKETPSGPGFGRGKVSRLVTRLGLTQFHSIELGKLGSHPLTHRPKSVRLRMSRPII